MAQRPSPRKPTSGQQQKIDSMAASASPVKRNRGNALIQNGKRILKGPAVINNAVQSPNKGLMVGGGGAAKRTPGKP